MSKETTSPYRGLTKRFNRKTKHDRRANIERKMFEDKIKQRESSEVMSFWVKTDELTPTDYFIVEFNLKNKRMLADFKEELKEMVRELIEEN